MESKALQIVLVLLYFSSLKLTFSAPLVEAVCLRNNRTYTSDPSRASQRGLIFCRFLCKRLTSLEAIPSEAQMAGDTVMRHFVSP
jgi:hypothetical protein